MKRIKRWQPPLKTWTENAALRATNTRMKKIEALLLEIGGLWGYVDEYIVHEVEDLRQLIEGKRLDFVLSVQARAEEREQESAS
jgi:hypothetical protein